MSETFPSNVLTPVHYTCIVFLIIILAQKIKWKHYSCKSVCLGIPLKLTIIICVKFLICFFFHNCISLIWFNFFSESYIYQIYIFYSILFILLELHVFFFLHYSTLMLLFWSRSPETASFLFPGWLDTNGLLTTGSRGWSTRLSVVSSSTTESLVSFFHFVFHSLTEYYDIEGVIERKARKKCRSVSSERCTCGVMAG